MKKLLTVFLCSFFLFGTVAVCSALQFTLENYTVSALSSDPGLVIQTSNSQSNDYSFSLNVGESTTFDLFDIWTNEGAVNEEDDVEPKPISVAMNFSAPPPSFGSTVEGDTNGYRLFGGWIQYGRVFWDGPVRIAFGSEEDGVLEVVLSNEIFNPGIGGSWGGECLGGTVEATFTYQTAATAPVPEPSTILLMGVGLLGLVAVGRRKFNPKE